MRVLVVNPVGTEKWDRVDEELFSRYASSETEIKVISLGKGPKSLERRIDEVEAMPLVIKKVMETHGDFDAVIVNCFLDPGVEALRSLLNKPVLGPCESSIALASLLGKKISVITVGGGEAMIEEKIVQKGYGDLLVSVKSIDIGVLDIDTDLSSTVIKLVKKGEEALKEGAEVVVLGCTGLAGLAASVEEKLGIPVVDPAAATLKMAEALVKLRLVHSRRRY
ncbi:MAG TPA: hydantoin racemase [Thermofilum sp.]|nr:hydantoin racemase [Thermofilum sp.]